MNKIGSISVNSYFIHKLGDIFSSRVIVALFVIVPMVIIMLYSVRTKRSNNMAAAYRICTNIL
jgi:hypothetical protein